MAVWTLCWTDAAGKVRWDRLNGPDAVAEKLLQILAEHNQTAGQDHEGRCCDIMDFKDDFLLFSPDADDYSIGLEDVVYHCSDDWIKANRQRIAVPFAVAKLPGRVFSLNEAYARNQVFYYCNACGDINIPGCDPLSIHQPDELPALELELYENYWTEEDGCTEYVVTYRGEPGMAITVLFDKCWLEDVALEHDWPKDSVAMNGLAKSLEYVAEELAQAPILNECAVLLGIDTDPDGHELLFYIPYRHRARVKAIAHYLNDEYRIYDATERRLIDWYRA